MACLCDPGSSPVGCDSFAVRPGLNNQAVYSYWSVALLKEQTKHDRLPIQREFKSVLGAVAQAELVLKSHSLCCVCGYPNEGLTL